VIGAWVGSTAATTVAFAEDVLVGKCAVAKAARGIAVGVFESSVPLEPPTAIPTPQSASDSYDGHHCDNKRGPQPLNS
jgi:hypothetical protein